MLLILLNNNKAMLDVCSIDWFAVGAAILVLRSTTGVVGRAPTRAHGSVNHEL